MAAALRLSYDGPEALQVTAYPPDASGGMGAHFDSKDLYAGIGTLTLRSPGVLVQQRLGGGRVKPESKRRVLDRRSLYVRGRAPRSPPRITTAPPRATIAPPAIAHH